MPPGKLRFCAVACVATEPAAAPERAAKFPPRAVAAHASCQSGGAAISRYASAITGPGRNTFPRSERESFSADAVPPPRIPGWNPRFRASHRNRLARGFREEPIPRVRPPLTYRLNRVMRGTYQARSTGAAAKGACRPFQPSGHRASLSHMVGQSRSGVQRKARKDGRDAMGWNRGPWRGLSMFGEPSGRILIRKQRNCRVRLGGQHPKSSRPRRPAAGRPGRRDSISYVVGCRRAPTAGHRKGRQLGRARVPRPGALSGGPPQRCSPQVGGTSVIGPANPVRPDLAPAIPRHLSGSPGVALICAKGCRREAPAARRRAGRRLPSRARAFPAGRQDAKTGNRSTWTGDTSARVAPGADEPLLPAATEQAPRPSERGPDHVTGNAQRVSAQANLKRSWAEAREVHRGPTDARLSANSTKSRRRGRAPGRVAGPPDRLTGDTSHSCRTRSRFGDRPDFPRPGPWRPPPTWIQAP